MMTKTLKHCLFKYCVYASSSIACMSDSLVFIFLSFSFCFLFSVFDFVISGLRNNFVVYFSNSMSVVSIHLFHCFHCCLLICLFGAFDILFLLLII